LNTRQFTEPCPSGQGYGRTKNGKLFLDKPLYEGTMETPQPDDAEAGQFSTPGLLLKLVLLPGAVVLAIVMLILVVAWLRMPGGNVDALLEKLSRDGPDRWPAAVNLAAVLHEPGGAALKRDPRLAKRLSEILRKEIAAGRMDPAELNLRMYLCRALGEFQIADPLPVLLEAARTERHEGEVDVRRSAIEALAVLASNTDAAELHAEPQLVPTLLTAANDRRLALRCAAAFALGVVGGNRAEVRLEEMLADEYPETRYNAATGLARHGNPECVPVLVEMLDPDRPESTRGFRRAMIRINALRAAAKLDAANPEADLSELAAAVERLSRGWLDPQVRAKSTEVLGLLRRRHGGP